MIPATPNSLPFVEAVHRDPDDLTAQADYLKWLIGTMGFPIGDAYRTVAQCATHARELAQVQMAHEFIHRKDRSKASQVRERIFQTVGIVPGFNANVEIVVIPGPQPPQARNVTITVGAHWICERM